MKPHSIFYIISIGIFFASCSNKNITKEKSKEPDNLIIITREQFETDKMLFGEPQKLEFYDIVKCNGNIVAQPSGVARISTSVPGLVKKINCTTGQKVNKGQILFELSGNEFIDLQKDFAESASQMKRIRSEYERVKSLFYEKVGTEKEFILAESEFKAATAKYSALKLKIKFIGLDDTKIEEGKFSEFFSIISPLNGYISQINVTLGQYTDQQINLAEIYDVSRLQLRVSVFEKDLDKIKENQKITFTLLSNAGKSYSATVKSIGKNVNSDSKTILCFADIDDMKSVNFVNNAYVEAMIITNNDSVTAVPEESIIKSGGNNYLLAFVKNENNNYFLKRVKVDVGQIKNGYVEILNQLDITKIITKGGYNIKVE